MPGSNLNTRAAAGGAGSRSRLTSFDQSHEPASRATRTAAAATGHGYARAPDAPRHEHPLHARVELGSWCRVLGPRQLPKPYEVHERLPAAPIVERCLEVRSLNRLSVQ